MENNAIYELRQAKAIIEEMRFRNLKEGSRSLFESVLNKVSDLMMILSPSLEISSISLSMLNILGWNQSEMLGASLVDFIHCSERNTMINAIHNFCEENKKGILGPGRNRYLKNDGTFVKIDWSIELDDPKGFMLMIGHIVESNQFDQI